MIFNFIIILLVLIYLDIIGFFLSKKMNINTDIFIPLGFIFLIGLLFIPTIIILLMNLSFIYLEIIYLLIIVFIVYYIYINDYHNIFKAEYFSKFTLFKCGILIGSLIISTIAFIFANNGSDSYLYVPMILHPVYTNEYMNMAEMHFYDTIYYFYSLLTDLSVGNSFFFIVSNLKFFEVFLVVNSLALTSELLFKKQKIFVSMLLISSTFTFIQWLQPSFLGYGSSWFIWMTAVTGTLLLIDLIMPLLVVSLVKFDLKKPIFHFFVVMAGFSFSSSMIFLYPFYSIVCFAIILFEQKDVKDRTFTVLIGYIPLFISLYLYKIPNGIIYLSIFLLLFSLYIGIIFLLKRKSTIFTNFVIILTLLTYLTLNFFIIRFELHEHFYRLADIPSFLFQSGIDKYIYSGPLIAKQYFNYLYPTVLLFIFIPSLVLVYKVNKQHFKYVIFSMLLTSNFLIYLGIGTMFAVVYARAYMLVGFNLVLVYLFVYLKEKVNNYNIKYSVYFALFCISISSFFLPGFKYYNFKFNNPFNYDNLLEYKINDPNVYALLDFDFEEGATLNSGVPKRSSSSISQIYQLNPTLNSGDECTSNCYYLYNALSDDSDLVLVFITEDYYLYRKK